MPGMDVVRAEFSARPLPRLLIPSVVVIACLLLIAMRLHAFDLPLEPDECNYAYIAARLLDGDQLYVDVWDHQPPGIFALFAIVSGVFGDESEVFRWLAMTFSLVSLLAIFMIARRSAGDCAALVAVVLWAMVSSDPGSAGEGCNREIFMNTFVLAGWLCILQGMDAKAHRRFHWLVLAGVLLALGSLIKTVLVVPWLALALWLGAVTYRDREADRIRHSLLSVLWFAAGPVAVWGATLGYFAGTGRLSAFVDAVFLFNLSYSGAGDGSRAGVIAFFNNPRFPNVFDSALPLWITGGLGLIVHLVGWLRHNSRCAALLVLMTAAMFVAVCMPAQYWPHYYYLLVPCMVLSAACATSPWNIATPRQATTPLTRRQRTATFSSGAAIAGLLLVTQAQGYLTKPALEITVDRYKTRDFWGRAQGRNVARVTDPTDSVFVFGNDPGVYYYSGRRCASRYTMITGLHESYEGAQGRREILMQELRTNPPRIMLVLFDEPAFPEWVTFLKEYYESEPSGWDFHDIKGTPIMLVLARKNTPIQPIDWDWDRSMIGEP